MAAIMGAPLAKDVTSDASLVKRYKSEAVAAQYFFLSNYGSPISMDPPSATVKLSVKVDDEYSAVKAIMALEAKKAAIPTATPTATSSAKKSERKVAIVEDDEDEEEKESTTIGGLIDTLPASDSKAPKSSSSTALILTGSSSNGAAAGLEADGTAGSSSSLITQEHARRFNKPQWHAPWKLMRVIPGHLGWVRGMCVDPTNEWFATASDDRCIKIWDLASGILKLTLTGHINSVMAVAVSSRSPYLFSGGLDKQVKCWDLEQNKIVRHYHGHLSGVYSMALHPTLDLLVTGARDSTARVWDIRTKQEIATLAGHTSTVGDILALPTDPQIITGSHDSTIKCWDLVAGKASVTLTNHKKSVRALVAHPTEHTFASGSPDNIKVWKLPEAKFLRNIEGHNSVVNCMAVNRENVLVSGGDNGSLMFWDWKTGYNFQTQQTIAQPGSLDSEAGIFDMSFDMTGSRLFTCEADKTVKVWKEDDGASEETHPINYKPKKRKRY